MWIDERGSEILQVPECFRLLALAAKEDGVGRIAVSRPGAPIVQPVNFAYCDHGVFVRLGDGVMADAASGSLVAFEVDRVNPTRSEAWSVLVRGLALEQADHSPGHAPRPFVSIPGQRVLFIRADVITGRRLSLRNGPDGDLAN
jgi:nitroimidazol reductase NimA-like FMN-containing flavoprotein (pyridoxamine 5'-phosphate oxidase superfamily)